MAPRYGLVHVGTRDVFCVLVDNVPDLAASIQRRGIEVRQENLEIMMAVKMQLANNIFFVSTARYQRRPAWF